MTGKSAQTSNAVESSIISIVDTLLPRLAHIIRQAIVDPTEPDRLTLPQLRALQAISRTQMPGALNAQLARQLNVAAPSMTAMIDGLVERGLVDRSIDPNNRRQVLILLTAEGTRRLTEMEVAISTQFHQVVSYLDVDERARTLDGLQLLQRGVAIYQEAQQAAPE